MSASWHFQPSPDFFTGWRYSSPYASVQPPLSSANQTEALDLDIDTEVRDLLGEYSHHKDDHACDSSGHDPGSRISASCDITSQSFNLQLAHDPILPPAGGSGFDFIASPQATCSTGSHQISLPRVAEWTSLLGSPQLGLTDLTYVVPYFASPHPAVVPEASDDDMQPTNRPSLQPSYSFEHLTEEVDTHDTASKLPTVISETKHEFRFESRAVVIEDRSPPSWRRTNQNGLRCTHAGCKYRGSFKRKYELKRHMKKHTDKRKYPCPAELCDKTFYRLDKISQHLRQAHADGDEATCPLPACHMGRLPWELMKIHSHNHERGTTPVVDVLKDLDFSSRRCPVASCQRHIEAQDVQAHLLAHSSTERMDNRRRVREAGFDPESVAIICPVCGHFVATTADFADHVEASHLVTNTTHFHMFRDSLSKTELNWGHAWYLAWRPEPLPNPIHCSYCSKDTSTLADISHHIELLQDFECLRPFRLPILRLWPEFSVHPIFDDLLPKVQRREWRWVSI